MGRTDARPAPATGYGYSDRVLRPGLAVCAATPNRAGSVMLSPGLVPSDPETFDDFGTWECGEDLAGYEKLRPTQA